ncbi:MAG: hypothetical protein IKT09_02730 [Synergistes sp.]|nr:hypothetical protein [Synergistes sp.]
MRKLLIIMFLMLTVFVSGAPAYEVGQPLGSPAPSSPEYEKFIKQKTLLENAKKKIEADLQRIASEDVVYMKSMMEADRERDMWKEIEKHIISAEKAEPRMEVFNGFRSMKYEKGYDKSDGIEYFIIKTYQIDSYSGQCQSFIEGHITIGLNACDGIYPIELKAESFVVYTLPLPDMATAKTPKEFLEYYLGARLRKESEHYVIERIYDYYFAERAGLKAGDVILTIRDIPVTETNLNKWLASYIKNRLDFSLKITVQRENKMISVYHKNDYSRQYSY